MRWGPLAVDWLIPWHLSASVTSEVRLNRASVLIESNTSFPDAMLYIFRRRSDAHYPYVMCAFDALRRSWR